MPKPTGAGADDADAKALARSSRASRTPADSDKDYVADSELDYIIPGARLIGRLSQISPFRFFLIGWADLLYPTKRSTPARVQAFKKDHAGLFWTLFAADLLVQVFLIVLILVVVISVVAKALA